tara:strand:- start:32 stop:514 length:483 start_codon:yes stop_codon:yes gene_type:complete
MKNNKGFTLIELLVVVAIIGILAAVGTIAYTGYTASAQKNASKTLHSQSVKYLTAEIQKCVLDDGQKALGGSIDCDGDKSNTADGTAGPSAANYVKFFVANSTDKNPHSSGSDAAVEIDASAAPTTEGQLELFATDTDVIEIKMLPADGEAVLEAEVKVE